MDRTLIEFLRSRPDLLEFVRRNPSWYRYLSRDPAVIHFIENEAKVYYGKTVYQRIEKVSDQIQLAGMLLQFAEAMKD